MGELSKLVGLSKSSVELASCSLILLITVL